MPTYAAVTKSIEDRFTNDWTLTPVAFKNVPPLNYDLPNNPPLAEGTDPYIKTKIVYGITENMEVVKSPSKRTYGSLAVDLHMKKDKGSVANCDGLDALSALFEYQKIDGIVFREIVTMQDRTFGDWFVTPTLIRFHFDR